MKKINTLILTLALVLGAFSAQARIRSIVDWDGGTNPYQEGSRSITGEKFESSCSKSCIGFSLTTTTCAEGMKLMRCPVEGCGYYGNCMPQNPGEASNNEDRPNFDEINIDEIYNQIVSEQQAIQDANNKSLK